MGMDNNRTCSAHKCGFEIGSVFQQNGACPALGGIWLLNSLLSRISHLDEKGLESKFSSELQNLLSFSYPRIQVFWTPLKEKSSEKDQDTRNSEQSCNDYFTDFDAELNKVLFRLNYNYSSHLFLHNLSSYLLDTGFCPAYIFFLEPNVSAISLTVLYRDDLQSGCSGHEKDFELTFSCLEVPPFVDFIKDCRHQYYLNHSTAPEVDFLENAIVQFVEAWGRKFSVSGIQEANGIFRSQITDAIMHFCIMSLYMELNRYSTCSYFIVRNSNSRYRSSMVIYWPEKGPDRNLQYLLSLALRLNSYPLLLSEGKNETLMTQRHNIFNLMPLDDLAAAIDSDPILYENKRLQRAVKATKLLNVCLNIALRDEVDTEVARKRTYRQLLEFFRENNPWSIEPVLVFYPDYVDVLLESGKKVDAFNVLWNLWHNAAKDYSKGEANPKKFWVLVRNEGRSVEIIFVNFGEIPARPKNYLLGIGPTHNSEPEGGVKGLEIVKEGLAKLKASVDIVIHGGRTSITVRIPQ